MNHHVLDNPVWATLTRAHTRFTEGTGLARRYAPDICPFAALSDQEDPAAWTALHELVGPGGSAVLVGLDEPPAGWERFFHVDGVQMTSERTSPTPDGSAVETPQIQTLTSADVPEMLALVARTQPGPFEPGTYQLGTYLGVRRDDRLVAMAGERLHPAGWTEISAVCTDTDHRGQGLGSRLLLAVAAGIRERGEQPMLHAGATNTGAIRLYQSLGFRIRRPMTFTGVRPARAG